MEEDEIIIDKIKKILICLKLTAYQRIMLKRNYPEIYQYIYQLSDEICYRNTGSKYLEGRTGNRAVYNIVQNTGNYIATSNIKEVNKRIK